jgi:hypothetical protein
VVIREALVVIRELLLRSVHEMNHFEYNVFREEGEYERGGHLATYDYETGYMHAMDDCRIQNENSTMIGVFLLSMGVLVLMLVIRPHIRQQIACGQRLRMARLGARICA